MRFTQSTHQSRTHKFHALAGELRGQVHEKFTREFNRILEVHAIVAVGVQAPVGQLPDGSLQPLLVGPQIGELIVLAEVGLHNLVQLLLEAGDVRARQVGACLVPDSRQIVVEGAEEVNQHNKSVELVCERVRGVVGKGRDIDGGLQCQWSVTLESM
jgi:hypothetical protein